MAYPDKLLADDEKVIEHLHPHWITLVPATFWFFVICIAGGFGIGFAPSSEPWHLVVIIAIVVVGLALLAVLSFSPWLRWRTTHYVFTTHRVLIRSGVLRHVGRDISLQRINDVGFVQSLWDRVVKAGTLTIESAGEHGQQHLHNIPKSDQMQQLLNRLIEEDGERRARLAYGGPGLSGYGPPAQAERPGYGTAQAPDTPYPPAQGQPYPPTQQYPPTR